MGKVSVVSEIKYNVLGIATGHATRYVPDWNQFVELRDEVRRLAKRVEALQKAQKAANKAGRDRARRANLAVAKLKSDLAKRLDDLEKALADIRPFELVVEEVLRRLGKAARGKAAREMKGAKRT